MIRLVAASEKRTRQTEFSYESKKRCGAGVFLNKCCQISLEREALESESLVGDACMKIPCKE